MPKPHSTTPESATPHKESELAEHIAAILASPFTPTELYNAITEVMATLYSAIPARESCDTVEFIERTLNWHGGFGFRTLQEKAVRR